VHDPTRRACSTSIAPGAPPQGVAVGIAEFEHAVCHPSRPDDGRNDQIGRRYRCPFRDDFCIRPPALASGAASLAASIAWRGAAGIGAAWQRFPRRWTRLQRRDRRTGSKEGIYGSRCLRVTRLRVLWTHFLCGSRRTGHSGAWHCRQTDHFRASSMGRMVGARAQRTPRP